jgi:ribosome-associated toxin RatA of RatAB toxin-antitoxin module
MPEESTQSIVIEAPPADIMAVIADFDSYPEWAHQITGTEVVSTGTDGLPGEVRLTVDAGPIKDSYTLAYDWAPDGLSVSWSLVKGQMQKAQDGRYLLAPRSDGSTEVTYSLSVQLTIPIIGLLRRKAEKVIMDTALRNLKRRVEEP